MVLGYRLFLTDTYLYHVLRTMTLIKGLCLVDPPRQIYALQSLSRYNALAATAYLAVGVCLGCPYCLLFHVNQCCQG